MWQDTEKRFDGALIANDRRNILLLTEATNMFTSRKLHYNVGMRQLWMGEPLIKKIIFQNL